MNEYFLLLLIGVIISSFSQVLLKKSAKKKYDTIWKEYINIEVIAGYGMLVLSTIATILALRGIEFKNVSVVESLGYVFIIVLSRVIFKEKITKKKLAGNILIISGIIIFYL